MDKLYGQPHTSCPVGNADHNVVICEPLVDLKFISGHRQIVTTKVMMQNERVMFASDLKKIKWEDLYHLPSCEEQLQMFTSNINELTDKHFSTKTVVRHTKDKPWVSDRFRDLICRRQHAWKAGDQALYRLYRNKVNRLGKSLKQNTMININGLKTSNPRNWWKGMKELLGCQQTSSDPPPLCFTSPIKCVTVIFLKSANE